MRSPHTATLDVDLGAIAANYRMLRARHRVSAAAAVVKADAYGLGMERVATRLWDEGCTKFFVATLAEGVTLRERIPEAAIGVFGGLLEGEEKTYTHYRLLPVLNDPGQAARWKQHSAQAPSILHVDTGMTRLGLSHSELQALVQENAWFVQSSVALVMSHLACAGEPDHGKNAEQLQRFQDAAALLPGIPASLANSSGFFLPREYHFDLGRPGCALYGINPCASGNPMQHVATLSAPILQVRTLDRDETVGYHATARAAKGSRIAIAALGYADGWLRSLSNRCAAYINGHRVPILGVVSMDTVMLDVSAIPEVVLGAQARAEFINALQTVDTVAKDAGTIGYEVFCRVGNRVTRQYRD